jgi:hypothetical protein
MDGDGIEKQFFADLAGDRSPLNDDAQEPRIGQRGLLTEHQIL